MDTGTALSSQRDAINILAEACKSPKYTGFTKLSSKRAYCTKNGKSLQRLAATPYSVSPHLNRETDPEIFLSY